MQVNLNALIERKVSDVGTTYKGNTKFYRSIGQNIVIAKNIYKYENGRFGDSSPSTGNKTRNIVSDDPEKTAKDFYDKIALGGIEHSTGDGSRKITKMADGSIVTWRNYSHSDGTSVVQINIKNSTHSGGIKDQKIHFVNGGKK